MPALPRVGIHANRRRHAATSMIAVGCALSVIIWPNGRAGWRFKPFWFRWNVCSDSAANRINPFGNAFRAAVVVADREQVPPP